MAEKRIPLRKCVACSEMIGKKGAVRVVRTPDGSFVLDETGKMNGRGAYLCRDLNCLSLAKKGKKLERSFKSPVPEELYDDILKELKKDE